MPPKQRAFMKQLEAYHEKVGMPRNMSAVISYLTVCEPAMQSSDSIKAALGISSGSISQAVNLLVRAGLVVRRQLEADRRHYYELDPDGWRRATLQKLASISHIITVTQVGIESVPGNKRIQAMHDIYVQFDQEFARVKKRLQ